MADSGSMTNVPIRTQRLRLLPKALRRGRAAAGPSPIVPPNSISGTALMAVVAIMSFLACVTVGAVTLVRDAAVDWQANVAREVTIQVMPVAGIDPDAAANRAAAIARGAAGVADARVLSAAENAALLEPWLGPGLDMVELPIPRLVVVEVGDPSALNIEALRADIATVDGAMLDDHAMWVDRLQAMANVAVVGGFAVLLLVFAATVLSVVFATRGAMAGNQHLIAVLHFIGAEDWFVAREFQRHFLLLGLKGGLAGALVAAILFGVLSLVVAAIGRSPEGVQLSALFGSFSVGPTGYFAALLVAFVIAVLTALTSRLTVFRYLAEVS